MKGHIRQRGERSWAIIIDLGRDPATGQRRQKWHSVKGTKRDAQRELARLVHEYNTGAYIEPAKLTVGEYLQKWLTDYAQGRVAARTYDRYAEIIHLHLSPALGAMPLSKLQPLHIQACYTRALREGRLDRRAGGLSAQTVLHHHRLLHEALEQAVRWQLLSRNPADAVEPPRPERAEMHVLDPAGVSRLLEAAEGTRAYAAVLLAVTTGLRRGELLGLRWEDIDLQRGVLSVQQTVQRSRSAGLHIREPKTQRSRRLVTLPAMAVEVLRKHRLEQQKQRLFMGPEYRDHGLAFPRLDGRPMNPDALSKAFEVIVARAGLPRVRFHDLRHTHATMLLQQGVNPKVVSERLGHSTVNLTLDTYSHVLPGIQEEVAQKVDNLLRKKLRE